MPAPQRRPGPPGQGPPADPSFAALCVSSSRVTTSCKYCASCSAHKVRRSSSPVPWPALHRTQAMGAEDTVRRAPLSPLSAGLPGHLRGCSALRGLLAPRGRASHAWNLLSAFLGPLPNAPGPTRAGIMSCRETPGPGLRRAVLGALSAPAHTGTSLTCCLWICAELVLSDGAQQRVQWDPCPTPNASAAECHHAGLSQASTQ